MGTMLWRSYVAIGDSFTEGMNDLGPDGVTYRGWADLVAARLAADYRASHNGRPKADEVHDFRYANLAIRGRLFNGVVTEQLPLAIAMKPALVSFAAGGNDVLRPRVDAAALVRRLDPVIGRLREAGADVVLFRFADISVRLPVSKIAAAPATAAATRAADPSAIPFAFSQGELRPTWSSA